MRIIARRTLREFWERYPDAEEALRAWYHDAQQAEWKTPNDIRPTYPNASFVANSRVVFNIRGNNYRLIVAINYDYAIVYVRFVGTHREYDHLVLIANTIILMQQLSNQAKECNTYGHSAYSHRG